MKAIEIGEEFSAEVQTDRRHTADQFGNPGLYVLATPALIWLLEAACHQFLIPFLDPGEGSVGTIVNVEHLATAREGTPVRVKVAVQKHEGRRVTFDVRALDGERMLMLGTHGRTVVRLREFYDRLRASGAG